MIRVSYENCIYPVKGSGEKFVIVCVTAGNGTAVVPSTSFDAGDWALCMGLNDWDRIDTLSGPGSVSALDDLSDVTISSAAAGQYLSYHSDGQWKNVTTIDGGTY